MGQYYKPINIDKMEYLDSWDYDGGSKLMEHSWIGNDFTEAVENLLSEEGKWHKDRIVWAGDYMDEGLFIPEERMNDWITIDEDEYLAQELNLWVFARETGEKISPDDKKGYRYIINHTKKEFVDKSKIPATSEYEGNYWYIHPLPLLTSSGNGRGGGDYYSEIGVKYIGSWAGDSISVSNIKPEEYSEIEPAFKEAAY